MIHVMTAMLLILINILFLAIGSTIAAEIEPHSSTKNTECAAKIVIPDEEEWCYDCDLYELDDELDCISIEDRPIPDESVWRVMGWAYADVVGTEEPTPAGKFYVPIHVRHQSTEKGKRRAVFATEPIKKGTRVVDNDMAVVFEDPESVNMFLKSIPRHVACDAMKWMWANYRIVPNSNDKKVVLLMDLNESVMFNNARSRERSNIGSECEADGCKNNKHVGIGKNQYVVALRDIEAGEELLIKYSEFSADREAWDSFFEM
jgi:hypothetical protein